MLSLMTLAPADNRLILFDQSDFGTKHGWYLAFENQGPEGTSLPVDSLRLILGVADGKRWRFVEAKGFRLGQSLTVGAKIGPDGATLTVDNKEVGHSDGSFETEPKGMIVGRFPDWASAPASYRLSQRSYRIRVGDARFEGTFLPADLAAFERPPERLVAASPVRDVELTTRVTIDPPVALPVQGVDAYGQVVAAEMPNRVRSDADLRASIAAEATRSKGWARDPRLDPYGGLRTAPWHEKPSGFYRVVPRGGRWTMVSPEGNPLFYTGLCTAPATHWDVTPTTGREALFAALPPKGDLWRKAVWGNGDDADYFTPVGWSLQRKYGDGWVAEAVASTKARLAQWDFSGVGKWCDEPVPGVPYIDDLFADWPKINRHLDPFDAAACAKARASLERQLTAAKGNPWIVGTAIGNERDETILAEEIDAIRKGPDSPAKAALEGLNPEAARKKYANAYYRFLYDTVKAIDPHHLYLGYWIVPGWWQNESDWDLIAPYCDAIGYDRYSDAYAGMEARERRTGKPVLLGEYSFPAWYDGTRGYGRYNVFAQTDADSGRKYAETIAAAARDPYCVGALWFQYRDEPATGRGPGKGPLAAQGEHFAFGFVDVNDRPKWDLVGPAREANRKSTGEKIKEGS